MRKTQFILVSILVGLGLILSLPTATSAQETTEAPTEITSVSAPDTYFLGEVVEILDEGEQTIFDQTLPYQEVRVRLKGGPEASQTVTVSHGTTYSIREGQQVAAGETVVIARSEDPDGNVQFYITDPYRLPALLGSFLFFLVLVAIFGRLRGLAAVFGLAVSFLLILKWVVPSIIAGTNPLVVILAAALIMATVMIYLAHGFRPRTHVAVAGTLLTLVLAIILGWAFVALAKLGGLGSESAYVLQFGPLANLDLRGLLLGGIIIGALGVLDDITTAQTAVVAELKEVNASLTRAELYRRGLSVGREHISSVVNTLVLAYAGASLPVLLIFSINPDIPAWLNLNSELLAEEIVRALVGSAALVLAVPITTALAAYHFGKK